MAANVLSVFLLILGIAGTINAFYPDVGYGGKKSRNQYFNPLGTKICENKFLCNYKGGLTSSTDVVYKPSSYQTGRFNRIQYPKWQDHFLQNTWLRRPFNKYPRINTHVDFYENDEQPDNYEIQHNKALGRHAVNRQNIFEFIRAASVNNVGNPSQSNADLDTRIAPTSSIASDLHEIIMKIGSKSCKHITSSKILSNTKSSQVLFNNSSKPEDKVALHMMENFASIPSDSKSSTQTSESPHNDVEKSSTKNTVSIINSNLSKHTSPTDGSSLDERENPTNSSKFSNDNSEATNIIATETKETGNNNNLFTKLSSLQEIISTNEENLETESTILNSISPEMNKDTTFDHKSSSLPKFQSTKIDHETESTVSQNPPFLTTIEGTSLKISSSFSDKSETTNAEYIEIKSTMIPTFETKDDTFKQSSTTEVNSEASQNFESDSTVAQNIVSSTESPLIPSTDKATGDETKEVLSTVISPLKIEITSEHIQEDHVIEIPSIRTARVVISSLFLVIALTAMTLLAVYMFRIKRRAVQYDQLLLIP